MSEPADKKPDRGRTISPLRVLLGVLIGVTILVYLFTPTVTVRQPSRLKCAANLHSLYAAVSVYAQEHDNAYPTPERWCDLLADGFALMERFRCPEGNGDRCDYALNPHAGTQSAPDVVLLFESTGGWNQAGGPGLLTTKRHGGKGCNVLFVDGHVEFIKAEDTPRLKWEGKLYDKQKETEPSVPNARPLQIREELDYWLRNMICHHQFRPPKTAGPPAT
jgi:prepilin-type processing-associated H-X9-DG protein